MLRSMVRSSVSCVFLVLCLCLIAPTTGWPQTLTPKPEIVMPVRDYRDSLSGVEIVAARQLQAGIARSEIDVVTFEYSGDGGHSWIPISQQFGSDPPAQVVRSNDADPTLWEALWDVTDLPSGKYALRVTMRTLAGTEAHRKTNVRVSKPPVPVIHCSPGNTTGTVRFDAASSIDPDGKIKSWEWDFGDGTTASGASVEHVFLIGQTQEYSVSLVVTDTRGLFSTAHALANALTGGCVGGLAGAAPPAKCECKSIDVSTTKIALGPKGDGTSAWPANKGAYDGKTLGPLESNPENEDKNPKDGKKDHLGYAFEVAVSVDGNPGDCAQIQLVKRTAGLADKSWVGTRKDLDLDGTFDIDVSTMAKCVAAAGAWNATTSKCTLSFPLAGTKYGPDEYEQGEAGGAYEVPHEVSGYVYKRHPDKKIVWWDAPLTTGTRYDADFIAIVRGTIPAAGPYCFARFSVNAIRNAKTSETITVHETKVGVAQTGLPKHGW